MRVLVVGGSASYSFLRFSLMTISAYRSLASTGTDLVISSTRASRALAGVSFSLWLLNVRDTSLGFGSRVTTMVSFCRTPRVGDRSSSGHGKTGDCGLIGLEETPSVAGCICVLPKVVEAEAGEAPLSRLAKALATPVLLGTFDDLVTIAATVSTLPFILVTRCLIVP